MTGEWPRGDGQIAIDRSTADEQHFAVGQTVGAFGDGPLAKYRSAGSSASGRRARSAGTTITVFDLATAQSLFDKLGKFDLDPRRSQAGRARRRADPVRSRPLLSEDDAGEVGRRRRRPPTAARPRTGLNIIKYSLLGFGGIALFVGSFVIANTLAITVAQRMRELATLRTLGASRRQVLGSVILESVIDRPLGLDHRALPGACDRGRADGAPRGDRRRPARPRPRASR